MTLRVVHTSDWHLGQTLASHSRDFEHLRFLDWLLELLEEERADALLVAGDVFDKVIPPASAERLLYEFLRRARQRMPHLDIVVIGGNHDGAARLDAPAGLLASCGVRVVGGYDHTQPERMHVSLTNRHGDVAAHVVAMPFLRPSDYPASLNTSEGYADCYAAALERARRLTPDGAALLAMGHCHVAGGSLQHSESERPILRGGEEAVTTAMFTDDVAYVALGHLHLAQRVDCRRIRYSGSPIPLSMSEASYDHQVLVVDLDGTRLTQVRARSVPRSVPLHRFQGSLDEVVGQIREADLPPANAPPDVRPFVDVRLCAPVPRARAAIADAIATRGARLVAVRVDVPVPSKSTLSLPEENGLESLSPEQVFALMHETRRGTPPDESLLACFNALRHQARELLNP